MPSYRRVVIENLVVEDYVQGPVVDELNKLGYKHYMTDVNIDNCDDVYGFYFVIKDVSGIQNTK